METEYNRVRNIFIKVYNGEKNFFTPRTIDYGTSGIYLYELSTNRTRNVFGVTVLNRDNKQKEFKLSKCFDTESEARLHIESLSN